MHVFTYGTLMFPQVWRMVVGREFPNVEASLPGYAVLAIHDAVYPGMIAAGGDAVARGLVYLDVDEAALTLLDRFEDDFYSREIVAAACADGQQREAQAYLVRDDHRHVLTGQSWTPDEFAARGDLERFLARYGGFGRIVR